MIYIAGIGSRETPEDVKAVFKDLCEPLIKSEAYLRSGGAEGADTYFHDIWSDNKEIYLPWNGFNGYKKDNKNYFDFSNAWGITNAMKFHPYYDNLSLGAKKCMIRNTFQVLGPTAESIKSSLVICWTKDGKDSGGTGQALRIARAYGIPIINVYNGVTNEDLQLISSLATIDT